jgi:glycosyltransferase involved in cell wall biosynthesis
LSEGRPRFSIVTAVYNVEPYLEAFIESIERQRIANDDLEVVAVDDGSTDGSRGILEAWATRSRFSVRVLSQPNAGQGAARNRGLEEARGEWVTFTDPDDMLEPAFLQAAATFAARHQDVDVLATRPVLLEERDGRVHDSHPRRHQFGRGNRVVDMATEPNVFPGSAAVTLYRLDRVRALGLHFDMRVRPNFEDGHFAVHFLLGNGSARVGLVRDAVYVYRKRASGTSTLQRSLRDPDRYTAVLEHGYLDVIDTAKRRLGTVPAWLQHVLIYELSWYLAEDEKISSNSYVAPDIEPRFHELLARILANLDPEVVRRHTVRGLKPLWIDLLAHAGRDGDWHAPYAVRTATDLDMQLVRINYRFRGARPAEAFEIEGSAASPAFAKTMAHRWYGRDLLYERVLWLPSAGSLGVRLGGAPVKVVGAWPTGARAGRGRSLRERIWLYRHVPPVELVRGVVRRGRRLLRPGLQRALQLAATLAPFRRRFADAWVVMDRIHDADDNGERLFEHLRAKRPDLNAWFVIERGTADWRRLAAAGERRVIAHGSLTWKMLMLHCRWLISSHVDAPIVNPPGLAGTRPRRPWKFAFLQHGVIKDDLSRWLNPKDIELFVVSTDAELVSVAGDGTPYRYTTRETRLTGLPRFDRLLEQGRAVPESGRNLVIVSPTWRNWLTLPLASGSQRREIDEAFWQSEYIRSWLALLRSPAVAGALAQRGWSLGFMPHPNLQSVLEQLDLPNHVQRLSFTGTDVQALYGRCALLVTDYSSVAFNAAYLDRPVVYFQFDREQMLGGAHVGRRGYFDYERDGYGPVTETLEAAEQAIVAAIEGGSRAAPEYLARIEAAFPVRDGGACARVVAAIEELSRPYVGVPD